MIFNSAFFLYITSCFQSYFQKINRFFSQSSLYFNFVGFYIYNFIQTYRFIKKKLYHLAINIKEFLRSKFALIKVEITIIYITDCFEAAMRAYRLFK